MIKNWINAPMDKTMQIMEKIKAYANDKDMYNIMLHRIEDNTATDPVNQRYDIDISYTNGNNRLVRQKLLLLKGELIDGETFHKRFDEFYPEERN